MRYSTHNLLTITAIVALLAAMQPEAQVRAQANSDDAIGNPLDASNGLFAPEQPGRAKTNPLAAPRRERYQSSDFNKQLLRAAQEAYEKSIADFRSGKVIDPEVVYRWSMRYMKAERAIGPDPSVALKGHLRRMVELAQHVENASAAEDTPLRKIAVQYYRAEAESQLAENKTDIVASSPHDAAIAVAESYLNAALKGDTEAAVKLAAPGSLAASKRMLDNFKNLGKELADGRMRVKAIQTTGQEKITVQTEVQFTDATSDGRATGEFVVELKQANGRWLVTNWFANKTSFPTAMSRPSPLGQSRPDPGADSAPKGTKVYSLKHAKADDLSATISQLLEPHNSDLRVAVDARTNRLLIHGTREQMEEIEALIQQLDEPSAASVPDRRPAADVEHLKPGQPQPTPDLKP